MRADLALIGFGNVARRLARLLEERRDWLTLDYDLECRVTGIATRRHGAAFNDAGLDAVTLAGAIEDGGAPPSDTSAADSTDVIRRLARSAAPMKVVVETTTLDIEAG